MTAQHLAHDGRKWPRQSDETFDEWRANEPIGGTLGPSMTSWGLIAPSLVEIPLRSCETLTVNVAALES